MQAIIPNVASLFTAARAVPLAEQDARALPADGHWRVLQGQHVHLANSEGQIVTAISGTLWITQDGDVRDWILEAGDSLQSERDADVLITAMSNATFRLDRQGRCI